MLHYITLLIMLVLSLLTLAGCRAEDKPFCPITYRDRIVVKIPKPVRSLIQEKEQILQRIDYSCGRSSDNNQYPSNDCPALVEHLRYLDEKILELSK